MKCCRDGDLEEDRRRLFGEVKFTEFVEDDVVKMKLKEV